MHSIDRRTFCQSLALGATMHGLPGVLSINRPNIVYILADDLGWGDLGCYNRNSAISTPNLDRLSVQGIRFTDMHSPSAVCTPTRYGILTGRYCWRSRLKEGVLWGYSPNLIEDGRLTVPKLLQEAGYFNAGIGKWHLGLGNNEKVNYHQPLRPGPVDHGFNYYFGIPASLDMDPYVYFENDRVLQLPTAHTRGSSSPRGVFWRQGAVAPDFRHDQVHQTFTGKAMDFLQQRAKNPSQPFFLYFPLAAPHTPWLPALEFRGRSGAGDYGDFVTQVDDTVGKVMRTLEETGLAGNTLLIFTSDNGADWKLEDRAQFAHLSNAGWRGEKADIWDGGHRIPFLARWPGKISPGSINRQLGGLIDLMATVAAIIGRKLPDNAGEDSFNLLPALIEKPSKPVRETIVHHSNSGIFAIRWREWKLVLGLGSGGFSPPNKVEPAVGGPTGQLYNLAEDPGENYNLYQRHPEIVERLSQLLDQYRRQGYSRPR